jgi:hypothetical protein
LLPSLPAYCRGKTCDGELPTCPFRNEGRLRALRGSTRTWPEDSDIELKFKADARKGVAMQTQGRRRLTDIALVVSKRGRDEGLLELAHGLSVEDATPVHLCDQRFHALLHGEPRLLRVHRFHAESKSNSVVLSAEKVV